MQKKLIALAVAFAMSAPAFADNANFTFYGRADVSYDYISTGDGSATANGATKITGAKKGNVSSNVSRFGFKGSEDLGGGLAAVWQIEQQINLEGTGTSTFATRNTFAGLKGEFGTVLMGKHDTPYKLSTRKLDVFGDSIADNRSLLGGIAGQSAAASFDGRQNDVLAYISPAMANVTIAAAMVNLTQNNTTDVQPKNAAFSIGAWYDAAPFYGAVAYEQHTLKSNSVGAAPAFTPNTNGDSESAFKGGFGFTMDAFNLGLVYEKTNDKLAAAAANKYGHSAYYVAGKDSFGTSAVKVAYGKLGDIASVANTGSNQISVGYDHGLSKSTKLYAIYSRISNKNAASYGFSQSTSANGNSVNGFGGSPTVISLGIQTNF